MLLIIYLKVILKERNLYILLSCIPFIIGIAGFFAVLSSPYMGINYIYRDDKIYIESLDTGSPASVSPEITDAEVLSIAGWEQSKHQVSIDGTGYLSERFEVLRTYGEKVGYLSSHLRPGVATDIVIKKNGVESVVHITPVSPGLGDIVSNLWISYLIAISFIIVATLMIIRKPERVQARVFYLLSFCIAVTYIASTDYLYISGLGNMVPVANPHLMVWGIEFPCAIGAGILPAAILHFCFVFPREDISAIYRRLIVPVYIVSVVSVILTVFMTSYYIYSGVLLVYLISGFILLGYKYIRKSSSAEKTQIMVVFLGIVAPVVAEALFDLPTIALIPVVMAFAITRYRLIDIETLFDNTLIYLIILGIFAMLDVGFMYILSLSHIHLINPSDIWLMVITVWLIMLTYLPVRNFVTNFIKKLLKREIYDTDKVMIEFQNSLLGVRSTSDAVGALVSVIDNTLHPIKTELFSYGMENSEKEIDMIRVPLRGLNGEIGVLELGPKYSGNTYTQKDINLLRALSDMASVVIIAIEEREKAQREKDAIAREIHDNIGHSFVMAKYVLMGSENKPELNYIIDNGLAELREVLAFTEGEEQTLGDFIEQVDKRISYFRENFGLRIDIAVDNENEDINVSYIARSNFLKIIQEAVFNSVKYSCGDAVVIEFAQTGDNLTVSVTDNGKGFEVSDEIIAVSPGLRDMKQKAAIAGAIFSINSRHEAGKGVCVSVSIKL